MRRATVFALVVLVLEAASTSEALTKRYMFIPSQSTLHQTGGLEGVDELFTIEGYFKVTIDYDANTAAFDYVNAIASNDSNYGPHDINEVFQMTQLVSTEVNEFLIRFEDTNPPIGGIEINLVMTFQGGQVHLTGTRQWPSVPDSFQFDIDAVAQDAGNYIYVDDDANGLNNGSSWDDAYNHLQDALTDANGCGKPVEVRVAQGVYKPDSNSVYPDGTGDREASFYMINGVAIKGGYAGYGEGDPDIRDFKLYETILSGDLDGNDVDVNDPCDLLTNPTRAENSYNVVTSYQTDIIDITPDVLDGFTITGGNANGPLYPHNYGGGMLCNSDATVRNCMFTGNSADRGGGMYCGPSWCCVTVPTLTNCMFISNSVSDEGGGLWVGDSNPILTNCTISGNSTANNGGGMMFGTDNFPTLINCHISGNSAGNNGGGMFCSGTFGMFTGCVFSGNSAGQDAGGFFCTGSLAMMSNCTFTGNSTGNRGGGINNENGGDMTLSDCIIWANQPDQIYPFDIAVISYSDIQGGWPGEGNIDIDPYFADPCSGDYHLQSQAGRWDANSQSWVTDANTSPCIDAGDPNSDWTAELWPHGKRINMGAYGGTPQASMSLSDVGNIADLDNDGDVDYNDLKLFTGQWPVEQVLLAEDLDRNGKVDFKDYVIFGKEWFNEYLGEPGIEYQITACGIFPLAMNESGQTRFTVTVEGSYIHFEDTMVANCCATELWLEMYVGGEQIIISEKEYGGYYYCICDYPVEAELGPFKPGIYTFEVYEDWGGFIGSTIVVIE